MASKSGLPTSTHFDLAELAKGVYAAMASSRGAARSNSGIVDLGGQTLLFDTTMSHNASRDLVKAAKELTGNPVSIVITSHYHPDHTFGNMSVPPEARIISTARTRELCVERLADRLEGHKTNSFKALEETQQELDDATTDEERELRSGALVAWQMMTEGLGDLKLRYPDETFEQAVVFYGSKRAVKVMTVGGGHTDSDAFMWLPDDKIIFTADLLFNGRHPWAGDGSPTEWARILDDVKKLGPQVWVPGHGAVTDVATANLIQVYMRALDAAVATAIEGQLAAEEIAALSGPSEFANLDNPSMFGRNVQALVDKAKL
jgi:glyoxylase-like metal-dependent hydrolase (beta-lactamase superfamily II)